MRATLLMLAALGLGAQALSLAWAQSAVTPMVSLEQACAAGPGRRTRLESVIGARAELECRLGADGRASACAVTQAAPDNPTVRYFALEQVCSARAAPEARVRLDGAGARVADYSFHFDVACERWRGTQLCSVRGHVEDVGAAAGPEAEERAPAAPAASLRGPGRDPGP